MRYKLSVILIACYLLGCKGNLDDKSKRNENWVWWVDAKTGKARWIPVTEDEPQVKDGRYTRFYFNGNVFEKGRLVDGKNVDTTFNYDIRGYLQYYILSKDSAAHFVKNGPAKVYYQSGSVKAMGDIKNHTYGDNWTSYFKNGKPGYLRNSKNGTGWAVRLYNNGLMKDSCYIDSGEEYLVRHYYPNGQLAKSIEFSNHNYNGLQKEYYTNGKLKAICPRVNGVFNGKEFRWYEDGHLLEISYKKDDEFNGGPDSVYYENGKVKMVAYMKNNKLDGEVKQYNEKGKLISDVIMKDGAKVEDKLNASLLH